jgi:DNA-binding CsgD family transcriptional regulator
MVTGERIFRTSEAAYAVGRDGRILVWNKASEQSFGYTKSEAQGKRCWKLLSGRDIFGNHFCCKGCPIRIAAFNGESANRFKISFKTATKKRKAFDVTTLILNNESCGDLFVHLCCPERGASNRTGKFFEPKRHIKNLTSRETQVLELLHQGMTIENIAVVLTISVYTVRNHSQHILSKLNVHSRFEAVALSRKLGLI